MDISWYGQACIKVKGKITTLLIDPFDPAATGLKLPKDATGQVVLSTHNHPDHNYTQVVPDAQLVITGPGEYEISQVSIIGTKTYHDTTQGLERGLNTVYSILIDGISVVHLGDLGHPLNEEQISEIESPDILCIPVGGVYTIDAETASKVVSSLEPKIVIPIHYKIEGLKYDLGPLSDFLKEMGAEQVQAIPKLSVTKDKLPEETTVVVLSKS